MERGGKMTHQLLEPKMTVEYIDSSCLEQTGSIGTATLTTEDGSTLPITLIMSEQNMSDTDPSECSDVKDKLSLPILSSPPVNSGESTRFVIGRIAPVSGEMMEQTLYTIQFSEGDISNCTPRIEVTGNEDAVESENEEANEISPDTDSREQHQEQPHQQQQEADLHLLETTTRLEDFMDVVTTYKCKFCRFSCPWKSGLMSHIRNCHFEASKTSASTPSKEKTEAENQNVSTKEGENKHEDAHINQISATESTVNNSLKPLSHGSANDSAESTAASLERHVFLCGQCREGFESLEACKLHMVKDHNLKLEKPKDRTIPAPRKRGRRKVQPSSPVPESITDEQSTVDYLLDNAEDKSQEPPTKRQIRPPKGLEEDYFLGIKKRRIKREHLSDKAFRCNEKGCGYRFSSEEFLHYHSTCHSNEEKPFTCPECREKAEHWRGLSIHLWKEHSVDIDLHTCPECGYKTHSHFKLENHRRIHSDERGYICSKCGKGFKQLSQLRNHYVIHIDRKNLSEKRWYSEQKCDICNRTFSDSKCLRKHQQAVHNKLKPYVCTYCGHMSARKAMLQLHMRQHTGEKPFLCEHCEYRTGDHNSLRRHRMRHTGTKPYKCPHCPYACIQAISYKTHLKNKHPGLEGLFACSLCTFRSVSKDNYINHMSDHKRGAIPSITDSNESNTVPQISSADESGSQGSTQMHIPENTLQQLEGMLPGNITAAQLIYSCLNALSHEGGSVTLPPGVTASLTGDGSQTITIQLPTAPEVENDQFFLTIQQQDGSTAATLVMPSNEDESQAVDSNAEMETLQPIAVMQECSSENQSLNSNSFIGSDNNCLGTVDSNSLVITQTECTNLPVNENVSEGAQKC